ncbi:hypothetical protein Barb6_01613 [Bacteroidales bacterium Barb6]|nr:hypothetical protein Barb6_01613 [Bacteroidales bacterium Barb6]
MCLYFFYGQGNREGCPDGGNTIHVVFVRALLPAFFGGWKILVKTINESLTGFQTLTEINFASNLWTRPFFWRRLKIRILT